MMIWMTVSARIFWICIVFSFYVHPITTEVFVVTKTILSTNVKQWKLYLVILGCFSKHVFDLDAHFLSELRMAKSWCLFSVPMTCIVWFIFEMFSSCGQFHPAIATLYKYLFPSLSWFRRLWIRVWWNSHHSLPWCRTRQLDSSGEARKICLQWECF